MHRTIAWPSPRVSAWAANRCWAALSASCALNSARPIDIAFIDGIETLAGGEGPGIPGIRWVRPQVLLLGTNAVNTDTVATAVMGYDPRADRGTAPFKNCDNSLKLAEALGVGTADLKRIEVVGSSIESARFPFARSVAR